MDCWSSFGLIWKKWEKIDFFFLKFSQHFFNFLLHLIQKSFLCLFPIPLVLIYVFETQKRVVLFPYKLQDKAPGVCISLIQFASISFHFMVSNAIYKKIPKISQKKNGRNSRITPSEVQMMPNERLSIKLSAPLEFH